MSKEEGKAEGDGAGSCRRRRRGPCSGTISGLLNHLPGLAGSASLPFPDRARRAFYFHLSASSSLPGIKSSLSMQKQDLLSSFVLSAYSNIIRTPYHCRIISLINFLSFPSFPSLRPFRGSEQQVRRHFNACNSLFMV